MLTPYIDSHCHLTDKAFDVDREDVVRRMKEAGMIAGITIGCEDADIEPLKALLAEHPGFLFGAWAVHPEYPELREADVDEIAERASEPGMVAVGETGLDFYWCKEPLDWQRDRFRRHIAAARKAGKPLIIHARDAESAALEILKEEKAGELGFVMHCFCGSLETALGVVDAGGHVSFTGNLTFKKNEELRAAAREIPLERLLIETDSPYMAPVPFRGKRCEPVYSREVARTIALSKGLEFEEVLRAACENTIRLFRLPLSLSI